MRACGARGRTVWSLLLLALLGVSTAAGTARAGSPDPASAALETSRVPVGGDWVVVAHEGAVFWRPLGGAAWTGLAAGQVVPAESEVGTGPDGEVTLVLGGDRLVMAANSHLILPVREREQDRQLLHRYGRLRIDIETRPRREVDVRTPLLSLGIKGTSFELAVDRHQHTVLVLDGQVAVTAPDVREAIDLGPRQGWRQPIHSGSAPARLERRDLPGVVSLADPVRWHLPDTGPPESDLSDWSLQPVGRAQAQSPSMTFDQSPRPGDAGAAERSGRGGGWLSDWLDHQTSMLTVLLIAGGGLMILAVPAVMLGQNLRAQWQSRPVSKGRRRRSLTHG